jgi:hypothetical protein
MPRTINASPITPREQFHALNVLDYLEDIFTGSPAQSFTKEAIFLILADVRTQPELFDFEVLVAYAAAIANVDRISPPS